MIYLKSGFKQFTCEVMTGSSLPKTCQIIIDGRIATVKNGKYIFDEDKKKASFNVEQSKLYSKIINDITIKTNKNGN